MTNINIHAAMTD